MRWKGEGFFWMQEKTVTSFKEWAACPGTFPTFSGLPPCRLAERQVGAKLLTFVIPGNVVTRNLLFAGPQKNQISPPRLRSGLGW